MITCKKCGGDKITQQVTMMIDPNSEHPFVDKVEHHWDDFFWCEPCDEECEVEEKKD